MPLRSRPILWFHRRLLLGSTTSLVPSLTGTRCGVTDDPYPPIGGFFLHVVHMRKSCNISKQPESRSVVTRSFRTRTPSLDKSGLTASSCPARPLKRHIRQLRAQGLKFGVEKLQFTPPQYRGVSDLQWGLDWRDKTTIRITSPLSRGFFSVWTGCVRHVIRTRNAGMDSETPHGKFPDWTSHPSFGCG